MHEPPTGHPSGRARRLASRPARRLAAGLGLLALIAAAGYVATLPIGGTPTPTRAPDASGAARGIAIGDSAPDFVTDDDAQKALLTDLDGNPIGLDDFADKPLWIVFWATWCAPCQEEAEDIRALYHAHQDDGLAVLAIDVQEPAAAVREYTLGHDLDYGIGLDPKAAVRDLYGASALPSHVFLDGDGTIRDRYLGQMTRELMEEHLRTIIGS
jgi:cytochrome c biogenesis protein CcmG, thiol:disulfide interchange protein DsbE